MALPVDVLFIGSTGILEVPNIHLFENERHVASRTVTQYPVESGAEIVDHAIRMPMEVTLRAFVSSTPLSAGRLPTDIDPQFARAGGPGRYNRLLPRTVWRELLTFLDQNEVVTVTTNLGRYTNMVVERAETEQNAGTGENLVAEIRFRELQYAAQLTGLGDGLENNALDRGETKNATQADVQEVVTGGEEETEQSRDLSDALGEQITPFALEQLRECAAANPREGDFSLPMRIIRIGLANKSSNDARSTLTLEGRDYTIRVRYIPNGPIPYWTFQLDVGSRRVQNSRLINICTPILNPGNSSGLSGNFYVVKSRALPAIDSPSGPFRDRTLRETRRMILEADVVPRFGWGRSPTGRGWYDLYYVPSIGHEQAIASNEALGL